MKAYANKTETDVEKLVEKFNQWADERIDILETLKILNYSSLVPNAKIETFNWAKQNLERLAKEVLAK